MVQLRSMDSHPCTVWPLDRNAGCWDVPADTPESTITAWQHVATEYLWAMTGRRLGPSCPVTVRPCRKACADSWGSLYPGFWPAGYNGSPWIPYVDQNGSMRNAVLCGCRRACHCGPELCEIVLPGPVYDVTLVDIDGTTLSDSDFTVIDGNRLRRTGVNAAQCWPDCQDLTATSGTQGTFSVTYRTGLNLTSMSEMAMTELTAHFIRGCSGGCGCGTGTRQNLQRLSRQGVDLEFADPQQLFTDGRTGIEIVDLFIRSMNPQGLGSPLRVLSPDVGTRGRPGGPPEIWR